LIEQFSDSDDEEEAADDEEEEADDAEDDEDADEEAAEEADDLDRLTADELVKRAIGTNTNRGGGAQKFRKYLAKAKKLKPEYAKGIDEALAVFQCNSSGPAKKVLRALVGG
jgi:hypothetical protein